MFMKRTPGCCAAFCSKGGIKLARLLICTFSGRGFAYGANVSLRVAFVLIIDLETKLGAAREPRHVLSAKKRLYE